MLINSANYIGGEFSNNISNSSLFKTPVEFGLHYQHRVYSFKDISISLGVQDLILINVCHIIKKKSTTHKMCIEYCKFIICKY